MTTQKLLIIDDSPEVHDLVQAWLAGEPIEFFSCHDGGDAARCVGTINPDLILLDVDLPTLDGFGVCRMLKTDQATAEIPIVFLTGASSTEEKLRGLELGAADYVIKPFDPAELRARVKSALHTKLLLDLLAQKAHTLQESEERFRLLAENSSDVIFRHDANNVCVYASPASLNVLGYRPEDLHGRVLREHIHPADRALVQARFDPGSPEDTAIAEFRFRRQDGQYVWLEAASRRIRDRSGQVCERHSSARDVTARKELEIREQIRSRILELITQGCTLDNVLSRLVEAIEAQETSCVAAGVLLNFNAIQCHAPRLPDELVESMEWQLLPLVERFHVLSDNAEHRVVFCDLRADPAWARLASQLEQQAIQSCWAIPIYRHHRETCGAFVVFRPDQQRPGSFSTELMKLASNLTSLAIEHRQLTDRLTFQAHHDALTQLPNRVLFTDRLRQALPNSNRSGQSAAVLLIDVDHFKYVNDTYGHQAGDMLLCQLAQRFSGKLRISDTLARMGGDEFAVILANLSDPEDAGRVAGALLQLLRQPLLVGGRELFASVSIGSAVYPRDAKDPESLLKHADLALYAAKDAGRNTTRAFTADMSQGAVERLETETALRHAIANDQLRLHYQPKVDCQGRICGLEALVRWQHPTLGLFPPSRFIPLAEETSLILPLGNWVLQTVARQVRAWVSRGIAPISVAVNVSTLQFAQCDFVQTVKSALDLADLKESWLQLELTESLLMKNMRDAVDKLHELKQLGVSVAVDDFGTAYSSFTYLQRLTLDVLKIDHSFTAGLDKDDGENGRAIIRAIIALAKSLGITVVAEGVETLAQRDFLALAGCQVFQGYLFGRPSPPDVIEAMLREKASEVDAIVRCA